MTEREIEEYRALRATIRERGTSRHVIVAAGLTGWAAVLLATAATMSLPVATLLPLLVLATVFQVTFALHTGVERVGRYLQVFHEVGGTGDARWEHVAMAFGRHAPKGGADPLFVEFFLLAALANIFPLLLAGAIPAEWAVIGLVHLLFVVHLVRARSYAARQRAVDLAIFERLKGEMGAGTGVSGLKS